MLTRCDDRKPAAMLILHSEFIHVNTVRRGVKARGKAREKARQEPRVKRI